MQNQSDLRTSIGKLEAKTKAGRLRNLIPMIEAKLKDGVRHVDILRALNEQGFTISEHTYRSYLQRYRKGQAKKDAAPRGLATPCAAPPTENGSPPTFDYDPRGIPDLLK